MRERNKMFNQTIPGIERESLSLIFHDNDAYSYYVVQGINPDYYSDSRKEIFKVCEKLNEKRVPIKSNTVFNLMGMEYVNEIAEISSQEHEVFTIHPAYYVDLLKKNYFQAKVSYELYQLSENILNAKPYEDTNYQLMKLNELTSKAINEEKISKEKSSLDLAYELQQELIKRTERYINLGDLPGIETGFEKLNNYFDGFCAGRNYILAARTSVGKTTLAINFARKALQQNKKVILFTVEMSDFEITEKLLSLESGVPFNRIFRGNLSDDDSTIIYSFLKKMAKTDLKIIHKFERSINQIETRVRNLHENNKVDFVIIDYIQQLQLVGKKHDNRLQEITEISGRIKNMALELNIPVLTLAQLNREAADDQEPQLHQIKDCGAIEQDADGVMILYTKNIYEQLEETKKHSKGNYIKQAEPKIIGKNYKIKIAKNRHGEIGSFDIEAKLDVNKFYQEEN